MDNSPLSIQVATLRALAARIRVDDMAPLTANDLDRIADRLVLDDDLAEILRQGLGSAAVDGLERDEVGGGGNPAVQSHHVCAALPLT
jgi:hypothetical protein